MANQSDADVGVGVISFVEVVFCLIASVKLYGWMRGMLLFSALSSLITIANLLRQIADKL